jgi:hypothetical protein
VRDLVHQVRLEVQLEYRRQSAKDLGELPMQARRLQPYLSRFQNDWGKRRLQSSALEQTGKHRRTDRATSGDAELGDVEDEGDGAGEENRDNQEGSDGESIF